MATDAILTLNRLRCIRESDGTGYSEPYIWPVLMWVDDNTLATPSLVGVSTSVLGNARVVVKNDMRAGETADIPASVGIRRVRFEDGLTIRQLLLAVALWEEDETPEDALHAGFQAFSSELSSAVADNLFAFNGANEEEQIALIAKVEARVGRSVRTAIENGLTGWQKARVLLGTLNLDDIVGGDFKYFPDLLTTPITLGFELGLSDRYEIEGELQVHPVKVELCQAQVNAVNTAQSSVNGLDSQIKELQIELRSAPPSHKPVLIAEIRRLRQEELPDAITALEAARTSLQTCRELNG